VSRLSLTVRKRAASPLIVQAQD